MICKIQNNGIKLKSGRNLNIQIPQTSWGESTHPPATPSRVPEVTAEYTTVAHMCSQPALDNASVSILTWHSITKGLSTAIERHWLNIPPRARGWPLSNHNEISQSIHTSTYAWACVGICAHTVKQLLFARCIRRWIHTHAHTPRLAAKNRCWTHARGIHK